MSILPRPTRAAVIVAQHRAIQAAILAAGILTGLLATFATAQLAGWLG